MSFIPFLFFKKPQYTQNNANGIFTQNSGSKDRKLRVSGVGKRRAGKRKMSRLERRIATVYLEWLHVT